MLALVDNQLVRFEPALDMVQGGFSIEATRPSINGTGRVFIKAGGEIVQSGVAFYVMDGEAILNTRTGEYRIKPKQTAKIRAVFAGRHLEVTIR